MIGQVGFASSVANRAEACPAKLANPAMTLPLVTRWTYRAVYSSTTLRRRPAGRWRWPPILGAGRTSWKVLSVRKAGRLEGNPPPVHLRDDIRHVQTGTDRQIRAETQANDIPAPGGLVEQL